MQIYGKFEGMICPSKRICLGWEYVPLKRGPGILPQLGSTRCLRGVSGVTYRSIRAVGSEDSPDMCLHTKNLKIAATFFFLACLREMLLLIFNQVSFCLKLSFSGKYLFI